MNTGLSFGYPIWLLPLCFLCGIGYAMLMYYRDKSFDGFAGNKWAKRIMATLRFLTVSLLSFLLLSPFLKSMQTHTQKPIVAILQDNSESIHNGWKGIDSATFFKQLTQLKKTLSENYEVVSYAIGDRVTPTDNYTLSDKTTNLSDAFEQLNDIYYNQNLGAVILASDGIYNQGINPLYAVEKAPYTIYTIGLGDTTIPNDLFFGQAYYNKITYLNDNFSLRIDVNATNLSGKNSTLSIAEIGAENKQVNSKTININSNNFSQSFDFILPANRVGILHYRLQLSAVSGEKTTKNNTKDIFVEVLDGRQKILLVANAPHPDIAAIKQAIESNKNYQLDIQYIDGFSAKLPEYNLVILHQLPAINSNAQSLLTNLNALKKPILYIVGMQSNLATLNNSQTGIVINGNINQTNDVSAVWQSDFPLFTLSESTQQAIAKFPPLQSPFGNYKAGAAAKSLLTQKINNVATDYPLWIFADQLENKIAVIAGEGLWRWRMYDFLQNKNHEAFDELINKTVQYLAVKADKRPFRVTIAKNIFADNEQVQFDAQLYNANFEMINSPDVDLKITDEKGKEFTYKMSKTENYYTLNAGYFPEGHYVYKATVALGDKRYSADGKFSIAPLQLESQQAVADHNTLRALAMQHKGSYFTPTQMQAIAENINKTNQLKPILYQNFVTESFINFKWLFFLILLLLSVEWFLRKYMGGY